MMNLNEFFDLFGDRNTRSIFEMIVDNRRIEHNNLVDLLQTESRDVTECCNRLRRYGFIDESKGLIPEFSTYLVTEKGLSMHQKLGHLGNDLGRNY